MPNFPPLHPNFPLITTDTPLHTCALLARVRLVEYAYWPRRHVEAMAIFDHTHGILTLLCLN